MKGHTRAITLNMIANTLSFGVSLVISFFLTPYITKAVGVEAYGLVGLANSFTNYITVATSAINSMASRFIIVELHRKDVKKANMYFSSVLIANVIIGILVMLLTIPLIFNIQILNVSDRLLFDARMTFAIIIGSFLINLIGAFYGIVLYAKNMIWKGAFRTLESNIIRVLLLFILFSVLSEKRVYYVSAATALAGVYCIVFNVFYTKKYTPELKASKKYFSIAAILELVSSGVWNSITKLSQILLDGLDLMLSNLFISGVMTGNVSIGKTLPSLYTSVVALLSDSFYPSFLEYYSRGEKSKLLSSIKNSINVLSSISGICLSMLLVYCKEFYTLWVPGTDATLLKNITILSAGTVLVSGCIYSLYSVFSITNRIRNNSIALLVTGILSIVTTFILLKFTDAGVYAIVGVSSIYGILRNLTFTPIYAAKCLELNKFTFYPVILRNLLNCVLLVIMNSFIRYVIAPDSWMKLVECGIAGVTLGALITGLVVFNRDDRAKYTAMVHKRFRGKSRK